MQINNNYVCEIFNWLMEECGQKPYYEIRAQFRDTKVGNMHWYSKIIYNKKNLSGEELQEFLQEQFDKFIKEKEATGQFCFVPFEYAKYAYPTNKKKGIKTWIPIAFYNESEKQSHYYFLRLAQARAIAYENKKNKIKKEF